MNLPSGIPAWQRSFLEDQLSSVDPAHEIVTVFLSAREWPTVEVTRRAIETDEKRLEATITVVIEHDEHRPTRVAQSTLYSSSEPSALARFRELMSGQAMIRLDGVPASLDSLGQASMVIAPNDDGILMLWNNDRSGHIGLDVSSYDPASLSDEMTDPYGDRSELARTRAAAHAYIDEGVWHAANVWAELITVFDAAMICITTEMPDDTTEAR